jgi:hypothetical protein
MRCYKDLKGEVEAKEGDPVALVVMGCGLELRSPSIAQSPILSNSMLAFTPDPKTIRSRGFRLLKWFKVL